MAREPSSRDDIRFMENFRRLRAELELRQADVAAKLQEWGWDYFTQTTLSRLEKGERPLRLGEARALATAVGKPMGEMLAPAQDVRVMDWLNTWERRARQDLQVLLNAQQQVYIASGNLNSVIQDARKIDPERLGDDDLRARFQAELEAAQATLVSVQEAVGEMPSSVLAFIEGLLTEPEGGDDGVDPEAS